MFIIAYGNMDDDFAKHVVYICMIEGGCLLGSATIFIWGASGLALKYTYLLSKFLL